MGRGFRIAATAALALTAPLLQGSLGRLTALDERLLAAHNRERAAAGLPALGWDPELAAGAAEWGEALAEAGAFEHSPDQSGEPEGENLWLGTQGHYTPEDMVGMWIAEKVHYRPGIFPHVSRTGNLDDVGHYTQLMWRDTGRVGCALAAGEEDEVLVCRYSAAGNVEGERVF